MWDSADVAPKARAEPLEAAVHRHLDRALAHAGAGGDVGDGFVLQLDAAHQVPGAVGQVGQAPGDVPPRIDCGALVVDRKVQTLVVHRHEDAAAEAAVVVDQLVAGDRIDPGHQAAGRGRRSRACRGWRSAHPAPSPPCRPGGPAGVERNRSADAPADHSGGADRPRRRHRGTPASGPSVRVLPGARLVRAGVRHGTRPCYTGRQEKRPAPGNRSRRRGERAFDGERLGAPARRPADDRDALDLRRRSLSWRRRAPSASGAARAADPAHPAVVELFQSQGCSSCPPANANFIPLADRPDVLAAQLAGHLLGRPRLEGHLRQPRLHRPAVGLRPRLPPRPGRHAAGGRQRPRRHGRRRPGRDRSADPARRSRRRRPPRRLRRRQGDRQRGREGRGRPGPLRPQHRAGADQGRRERRPHPAAQERRSRGRPPGRMERSLAKLCSSCRPRQRD